MLIFLQIVGNETYSYKKKHQNVIQGFPKHYDKRMWQIPCTFHLELPLEEKDISKR